jgi:TolB-like protein
LFFSAALVILGGLQLQAQTALSLDNALNSCVLYLRNQLPKKARVGILPLNAKSDKLSAYITERLQARLVNDGSFTVVERNAAQLKSLEKELTYQMSGDVSDETAQSIGKQLGVEWIISGSVSRRGDFYGLNIHALKVETAQIQGQWSVENIRAEAALSSLDDALNPVSVTFAGAALTGEEKDTLLEDLQQAIRKYNVPLELVLPDQAAEPNLYNFIITLRMAKKPPAAPAYTEIVTGDIILALNQGRKNLKQSERKQISEMDSEYFVRRGAEFIRGNKAFFDSVTEIVNQQNQNQ